MKSHGLIAATLMIALGGCVTASFRSTASTSSRSAAPLFLREVEVPLRPGMLPIPYILRETEGVLAVDENGCVYLSGGAPKSLIIWPPETVFDPQDKTFRTKNSGPLRFGDRIAFQANPGGPTKRSRIGNVAVPELCRRMNTLDVAPNGARKM